jgi:dTDP-4-dehydrorhamnose 3,5-epimerase-like enzyme
VLFCETPIRGLFIVDPEQPVDRRGSFARTWCAREFAERGLNAGIAQCAAWFNHPPASSRGLRWDDSAIGIRWPELGVRLISERDAALPLLRARRDTGAAIAHVLQVPEVRA